MLQEQPGHFDVAALGRDVKWRGALMVGQIHAGIVSEEQLADYKPLFENSRRLRELVAELHHLTLEIIEADLRRRGRPDRSTARSRPA